MLVFCAHNIQKEKPSFRGTFQHLLTCTGREGPKSVYRELCLEAVSCPSLQPALCPWATCLLSQGFGFSSLFHKEWLCECF